MKYLTGGLQRFHPQSEGEQVHHYEFIVLVGLAAFFGHPMSTVSFSGIVNKYATDELQTTSDGWALT